MKLADIFAGGMVLAANRPIRIFGEGRGRATVSLNGNCAEVVSDTDTWCVELPAMEYGGPYEIELCEGDMRAVIRDVYVGEVYLFTGQSNMTMMLEETNTPMQAYVNDERIRHVTIPSLPAAISGWEVATVECVGKWSAIGYLVCKAIAEEKGIHVGAILCAQGASVIETWMPEGALEKIGISIPPEKKHRNHFDRVFNVDGLLYNERLSRVIPFTNSGVIWYQGESDASEAEGEVYARELTELIRIWRADFCDEGLPFTVVQIADCYGRMAEGPGWRMIQEAQTELPSRVANTYTVISRDICETDAIHPPTKDVLSKRIAEIVRKHYFN